MYGIENMMEDIASNIKRDSDDDLLTEDSIIKRLRRFKDNVVRDYEENADAR